MKGKEEADIGGGISCIQTSRALTQSTTVLTPETCKEKIETLKKSDELGDHDTVCGIGIFRPKWIQGAANPRLFLFFYSVAAVFQAAQFTYLVGCLSTMEKRFAYDSKMSGVIMISDEISPVLLGVFVGYFGGLAHRPRLISLGSLLAMCSSFVMAVPYFLYGSASIHRTFQAPVLTHRIPGVKAEFCDNHNSTSDEFCSTSITLPAVTIFFVGNFLKGLSTVVFQTIGTAYIDDSVKKKNSPFYIGTLFALRLLGPTIGFLLSSVCLQYYEDPFHDPGFTPKDPRWIGAWWLGFVILGVAIFIFSLPMILFPRRFPGKKLPPSLRKKKDEVQETPIQQLKGMGKAMKRLAKNPILVCHYLGGVFRLNGIVGYYVLLPKYMEMQFRQSASKASLYSGPASIIGMQLGILFGGIAIRKFKPRPRVMTGCIVFAESFSVIALVICMFLSCPSFEMAGTTQVGKTINLNNDCNTDCLCTTKVFTPVCGPDGVSTYFSPCFAGCTGYTKNGSKEMFTDCKCVHDTSGEITVGDVTKSYCDSDCQFMITFIVVLSLGKLLSSTARVANTIVTLRCVDPEDKSIALGALSGIFSLLAFIPYPLIYGALTDASCVVWEKSCGKTGNCWIYDTNKFRFLLHGVSAMFVFLGCITDVLVCILSPRLRNLYDEDEDEKEDDENDDKKLEDEIINNGGVLGVVKTGIKSGSINSLNGIDNSKEKPLSTSSC